MKLLISAVMNVRHVHAAQKKNVFYLELKRSSWRTKMKNIEKYYDELKNGVDINRNYECWIRYIRTGRKELLNCDGKCICCYAKNLEWLNAEYIEPIRLTKAEKVILENLDENATHIKRQKGRLLMLGILEDNCFKVIGINSELFQFVKDEPLEIVWLLENCEVIEECFLLQQEILDSPELAINNRF